MIPVMLSKKKERVQIVSERDAHTRVEARGKSSHGDDQGDGDITPKTHCEKVGQIVSSFRMRDDA